MCQNFFFFPELLLQRLSSDEWPFKMSWPFPKLLSLAEIIYVLLLSCENENFILNDNAKNDKQIEITLMKTSRT